MKSLLACMLPSTFSGRTLNLQGKAKIEHTNSTCSSSDESSLTLFNLHREWCSLLARPACMYEIIRYLKSLHDPSSYRKKQKKTFFCFLKLYYLGKHVIKWTKHGHKHATLNTPIIPMGDHPMVFATHQMSTFAFESWEMCGQ
jgi:hypothetical protein